MCKTIDPEVTMITADEFQRLEEYLRKFDILQRLTLDRSNIASEGFYQREENRIEFERQDVLELLDKISDQLGL
jgi:hypothetical protein